MVSLTDGRLNNLSCLGIILLHEATQKVLFNTECVCGSINGANCLHKTRGYPISVVVLKKIRSSPSKR